MKLIRGFWMAWGTFWIIPCPSRKWDEDARRHMLMTLPLIGLFIGVLWGGLFLLLQWAGIHIALKAALMTVFPFIISGGIHLDGFMDCNDAIFSRRPIEEKQRILTDSNVGVFAAAGAIMMFLVFFAAMWAVMETYGSEAFGTFLVIPPVTRLIAAIFTLVEKPIKGSQYSAMGAKKAKNAAAWLGLVSVLCLAALIIAGIYARTKGIPLYIFETPPNCCDPVLRSSPAPLFNVLEVSRIIWWLSVPFAGFYAIKKLGGMCGDIAGYMIVWGELTAIVTLAII